MSNLRSNIKALYKAKKMKLVIIVGPQAVGKMTVGQNLSKITGLSLFHNHAVIEPVIQLFGFHRTETILRLRDVIFEDFANSNCDGMIFTYTMDMNSEFDWLYLQHIVSFFPDNNTNIYCVELYADVDIRKQRNLSANRLAHKPSKADTSQAWIDETDKRYNSFEGEFSFYNYIKVDNSFVQPKVVAERIKEQFLL